MTTKYYVKPAATATANARPRASSITPPASSVKQRTVTATKVPSRPSSDTQNPPEPAKMNRGAVAPRAPTRTPTVSSKGPVPRGPPTGGRTDLVPCKNCGRNFAPDRVDAHTNICTKTSRKKRKPFDVAKHRIQGTDIEPYAKKGRQSQPAPSLTKTNWRKKHEEFISNIRAAKEAQAHVARGGKLTDLPPPPPMDTSDLIPCPHCKRKFNDAAAQRHIPKCATMMHNKPKPTTTTKSRPSTKRY